MDKKEKKESQRDKNAQKIERLEEKLAELENDWKRALADYKNLEKRASEEKNQLTHFANSVLIENLLPVLDNFTMLEKHTDDTGVKMSIKEFEQVLQEAGLKEIEVALGDDFDPETMDAVETGPGKKDKVLQIIRKGYFFKDKLLRPTTVEVGRGEKTDEKKGN
jgi:molecular chaperone GrpE